MMNCICKICGNSFWVTGKRKHTAKYCSKKCANIGQPLNRKIWNRGLTKDTDERIKAYSIKSKLNNKMRGIKPENHPFYGKHHTEESRKKISEHYNGWQKTIKQINALEKGRKYFLGLNKENCIAIKERSIKLSNLYKGRKNPERSEIMKEYYKNNPEKHPNMICAKKGHITRIEKNIKEELEKRNIPFMFQYPINGYYLDFAIIKDNLKIDIECDGNYFHQNKEKDYKRDCNIKSLNWKVIRLEENDILNSPVECVDRIEKVLI